jgi:hypothetical protein
LKKQGEMLLYFTETQGRKKHLYYIGLAKPWKMVQLRHSAGGLFKQVVGQLQH